MNEPAICEACLGNQDRITRAANGAQCKICTLPFNVYHFKSRSAVTKTVICHNCSKQRNVCQCCLLDLQWHIPVEIRDRVLSLVQGSEVTTPEAQNEMMKRFIALKDGDTFKLGGANVTSDPAATAAVLGRIQEALEHVDQAALSSKPLPRPTEKRSDDTGYPDVDVTHLLKKLPLKGSLESTTAFFLYNIDSSVPEWAIVDAITDLVATPNWFDPQSASVSIIHAARCGGIRFKTPELGQKFAESLTTFTTPSGAIKGKFQVQNSRIHVVSWPQFNRAALGDKYAECRKLALSLDKLVQKDLTSATQHSSKPKKQAKVTKKSIGLLQNKKRKKRVLDIEL